jgi:starch synthase
LIAAARRAFALYRDRARWRKVQRRAMAQNFSWDAAAEKYVELYRETISDGPRSEPRSEPALPVPR